MSHFPRFRVTGRFIFKVETGNPVKVKGREINNNVTQYSLYLSLLLSLGEIFIFTLVFLICMCHVDCVILIVSHFPQFRVTGRFIFEIGMGNPVKEKDEIRHDVALDKLL